MFAIIGLPHVPETAPTECLTIVVLGVCVS